MFGLGYTSLGLANVLLRAGWRVSGTVRDAERAASLAARGVDAHVWRPDDGVALRPDALDALRDATHVLNSVPPVADFDRDPVLADPACVAALREKLEAVDAALAAAAPGNVVVPAAGDDSDSVATPLRWLGYLSSTSVYGDAGGAWVDETTRGLAPCAPKAVARLVAENAWREFFAGSLGGGREGKKKSLLRVFRLGGIYGPGRSALEAARREGAEASERRDPKRRTVSTAPGEPGGAGFEPSPRASRRFTSRCHVGDVVATLCASIRAEAEAAGEGEGEGAAGRDDFVEADGSTWRTYNVVDDAPAPRREAMAYAARLLAGDFFVDDGAPGAEDGTGIRIRGAGAAGEDAARARTAEGGGEGGPGAAKNTARGSGGGGVAEKRVRNDRIKRELGVRLMFPTYREGLAAIARGDATPFGADER